VKSVRPDLARFGHRPLIVASRDPALAEILTAIADTLRDFDRRLEHLETLSRRDAPLEHALSTIDPALPAPGMTARHDGTD
jgi:hypothetical protein